MEEHIHCTQTPTFFVFSDVQEGKHKPEDLERLIPTHILNSPLAKVVTIQPTTKSKMKKCLQSIAKAEGLRSLPVEFFEEAHLASGGDIRHAIFAMQFRCCHSAKAGGTSMKKDSKLSIFHALGKLLYAKRKPSVHDCDGPGLGSGARGPLDFDPEEVLGRIDMGVAPALSFLSFHCPDFFTDVADLSRSLDLMSDAILFIDRFGQDDGPFPTRYASCIGGGAVADGNRKPAPPQFRQFSAPQVFAVLRKNRENEAKFERLRRRLSTGGRSRKTCVCDAIGSAQQFVTDSLPFMRTVIPQDIDHTLANLHSYAKDSRGKVSESIHDSITNENDVLLEDDLVDDDEDDW